MTETYLSMYLTVWLKSMNCSFVDVESHHPETENIRITRKWWSMLIDIKQYQNHCIFDISFFVSNQFLLDTSLTDLHINCSHGNIHVKDAIAIYRPLWVTFTLLAFINLHVRLAVSNCFHLNDWFHGIKFFCPWFT